MEKTIEEMDIDEFYDSFYSDKSFNLYGKEQPCFFTYTAKKAKNYDFEVGKFDKPGPKFYTLD